MLHDCYTDGENFIYFFNENEITSIYCFSVDLVKEYKAKALEKQAYCESAEFESAVGSSYTKEEINDIESVLCAKEDLDFELALQGKKYVPNTLKWVCGASIDAAGHKCGNHNEGDSFKCSKCGAYFMSCDEYTCETEPLE